MVSQCKVKGADDHGVGKGGSIGIVLSGVEMISPRESISRSHMSSRGDFPDDVKVLKKKGPASLSSREFARVLEIGQVLMIGEDGDRVRSSLQILFPFRESKDNSKEFPIIDVIVALGQREGLGKISARVKISCLIRLH